MAGLASLVIEGGSNWPGPWENSRLSTTRPQPWSPPITVCALSRAPAPHAAGPAAIRRLAAQGSERIREFRTRMQQITPMLSERVTSFLHDIDAESPASWPSTTSTSPRSGCRSRR